MESRKPLLNHRSHEDELALARKLLESLVCPYKEFAYGDFAVNARIRYAGKLGGDYYGVIPDCPQKGFLTIFVGDVAGSGVSAALLMVTMMILLREASSHFYSPREVLTYLNRVLTKSLDAEFFNTSLFFIHLDTERNIITYARAGHEHGLHYGKERKICRELQTKGTLLGVAEDRTYNDESFEIRPGDRVLLYTDGLVEAKGRSEEFTRERLCALIEKEGSIPGGELLNRIFSTIDHCAGGNLDEDDQTLLVISLDGPGGSSRVM
jgi:serine phosphatase RsbU (regulator of sigma subunit)